MTSVMDRRGQLLRTAATPGMQRLRHVKAVSVRPTAREPEKGTPMFLSSFLIVAVVLVVAWALGWFAFHVAGGLIHILLVVAVISLVVHFLRGRP